MRIAVCSSDSLFSPGGARVLHAALVNQLRLAGHQVDQVVLPVSEDPETLVAQSLAWRWIDLDAADMVICLRPPAHLVGHPKKVIWWIHHHRAYYDLWNTELGLSGTLRRHAEVKSTLVRLDTAALHEARSVFANSETQARRLRLYNGVDSTVLMPPLTRPVANGNEWSHTDEILCVARIVRHKRQHLLIEALAACKAPVTLRLAGPVQDEDYARQLNALVDHLQLGRRVKIDGRWVSDEERDSALRNCLCFAYVPYDEDSYGYAALEAASIGKAIITSHDSGGVLELVADGVGGLVVEPAADELASAFDSLYFSRERAVALGQGARRSFAELDLDWDAVVEKLTE